MDFARKSETGRPADRGLKLVCRAGRWDLVPRDNAARPSTRRVDPTPRPAATVLSERPAPSPHQPLPAVRIARSTKYVLRQILIAASTAAGVSETIIRCNLRSSRLTTIRVAAWIVARERYAISLPAIGEAFDRDHSTILTAIKRARQRGMSLEMAELVDQIVRIVAVSLGEVTP